MMIPKVTLLLLVAFLCASCAGQVSVPMSSGLSPSAFPLIPPELTSKGTERIKIPEPNLKIKLPKKGDPFLYGLTVTDPLEAFYRAVYSKQNKKALQALEEAERMANDDLMRYAIAVLRTLILIPSGQADQVEAVLRVLSEREGTVFGKDFESTALRGEFNLWRGNLKEARSDYEKVLAAIGQWRVPTFYLRPPSNNNEIIYFGRAQLRAAIGLAGVLIQEGDYESALAWAVDAQKRFSDILGLTEHGIYGKYMKATPDLYTSHGWCLAFLAAARLGYSKDLVAHEELFRKAAEYFDIEGQIEGARGAGSLREYVLIRSGLAPKPTEQIGMLPELSEKDRVALLELFTMKATETEPQSIPSLPSAPQSFLKLPRAGEESPFGFKITPEYENALQAYLKGDGEAALSALNRIDMTGLPPATAWGHSYLRAQALIMMGRAADAELELEKTAELEWRAFGTNLNARSLRADARVWLGDYEAAMADFLQVIKALGQWRLPTSYIFPPADVTQSALRARAQLRAHVGLAAAFMFQGEYASAWKWARASEALFQDLFRVLEHPVYRHYVALDADMVYGRGMNLGILGAARLALSDIEESTPFFNAAQAYLGALDSTFGQVSVDAFRVRVLFDRSEDDLAESLADQVVSKAIEKGFSELVWQMEALRGEILLQQNREEEAEMAFRRSQVAVSEVSGSLASDRSKRRFGVGKEDITFRLVQRDIQKGNWRDLFRDLETGRARAFVDMLADQRMSGGREEQVVKEIRELDKGIRRQRLLNAAPGGSNPEGIEAEKRSVDLRHQKVEALRKRDPELAEALSIFVEELSEMQSYLNEGELLAYVLPVRFEEKISFFIFDSKNARVESTELSQEQLRQSLKLFRSFNMTNEASAQKEAADRLTQDLHLRNWKVTQSLYIVPSSELYFIPWGALDIDYPVVVVPTGSWLKRSARVMTSLEKTASVIGDPETGGALPKLPGAREEAEAVARVYGVTPLLGAGATEKALRSDMEGGVGTLHLATHGFFNDKNPLDSAVILSTGSRPFRLTAARLFENPLPAKVVVLSACESGLGQAVAGDDFLGLARSFYLGGTQAMIYSLWPVPDLPTKLFMEEFHRRASSGDYGKAWLQARHFMKEKGYAPWEYGAFILGGQNKGVVKK